MTIGELARQAGITLRTVRFYEEKGLITSEPLGRVGERKFSDEALIILRKIKALKEAGFSLQEIEAVLNKECAQLPTLAKERQQRFQQLLSCAREKISGKIHELEMLIEPMDRLLKYSDSCSSCSADDCKGCSVLNIWQDFGYKEDAKIKKGKSNESKR